MASTPHQGNMTPGNMSMMSDTTELQKPAEAVYTCGECFSDVKLKPNHDRLACKLCGFRILYKKRTEKLIVFDCR